MQIMNWIRQLKEAAIAY